ncbi:MAG: hypothetical protein LAT76_12610 [Schleiferiaceae bacterium]|nr:hypothetical protein [Schleiferiaceae bacterium]
MKLRDYFTYLFCLIVFGSIAQDYKPKNSLLLNLGSGTVASIDYERNWQFGDSKNLLFTSIGAGAGREGKVWQIFTRLEDPEWYFVSTQKVTYCVGNGTNFLEFGLGGIYVAGNTTQPYLTYPILGYRFIGTNTSTFKFYLSWPFSGIRTDDLGFVPFGISLGQFF